MGKLVVFVLLQVLLSVQGGPINSQLGKTSVTGGIAIPKSLKYLGTVEGKSYFADTGSRRNWMDSKAYCINAGMQLATITNAAQATFLREHRALFQDWHWIAGRDLQTINRFAWDLTNQVIQNPGVAFRHDTGITTCLDYNPTRETNGMISSTPCTDKWAVLCEVVHG